MHRVKITNTSDSHLLVNADNVEVTVRNLEIFGDYVQPTMTGTINLTFQGEITEVLDAFNTYMNLEEPPNSLLERYKVQLLDTMDFQMNFQGAVVSTMSWTDDSLEIEFVFSSLGAHMPVGQTSMGCAPRKQQPGPKLDWKKTGF